MSDIPLVSIVVITYNSDNYVLETLESIRQQTYPNIELCISDDCSSDNTVAICKAWLLKNESRFVFSQLITVEKNTGVSANCNRGVKAIHGKWLKLIAGDDILAVDGIKYYVDYVQSHDVKVLFAAVQPFVEEFQEKNLRPFLSVMQNVFYGEKRTAFQQHKLILIGNFVPTPSSFISTDTLSNAGGFDEQFVLLEDHPLWVKLTACGIKLHYMDKQTVYYRIHGQSITCSELSQETLIPERFTKRDVEYTRRYLIPEMSLGWRILTRYKDFLRLQILKYGNTRASIRCRLLYFLYRYNPIQFYLFYLAKKDMFL